jgi:hypothetical protein
MSERRWHPEKALSQMDSTDDGIKINCSDPQDPNANFPKRVTQLPLSNVTVESDAQVAKQFSEMTRIEEGMKIDRSERQ